MDEDLKKKIEAILFSIGKKIHIDELLKMIKEKDKAKVVACLIELKQKYNENQENSLMILQDGDFWKLTIKDQYIDVAKEIGIETELSKTIMETLAVIAYKYPILQSDVIKIRTNKAYDHLNELETLGYIQREKYGRTKQIKLTQKFFDYFDLPPDKLKDKFQNVQEMEKVIGEKENQIHEINQKKKEMIQQQDKESRDYVATNIYMKPREIIKHYDSGLEIIEGEKLGQLDVFDNPEIELEEKERSDKSEPEIEIVDEDNNDEKEIVNTDLIENNNANEENDIKGKSDEHTINEEDNENINQEEETINSDNEVNDKINSNNGLISDNDNNDNNNESIVDSKDNELNDGNNIEEKSEEKDASEENNNEESELEKSDISDEENNGNNNQEETINSDNEVNDKINSEDESKFEGFAELKNEEPEINEEINDENAEPEINKEKEKKSKLNEEDLFNMEGIPKAIMEKIEEKAEEMLEGEEEKDEYYNPSKDKDEPN